MALASCIRTLKKLRMKRHQTSFSGRMVVFAMAVACTFGVTAVAPGSAAGAISEFSGSTTGDFALIQSAPGAITEVSDPAGSGESVLKLTVSSNDVAPLTPTANPRAQLLSPAIVRPGDEFWLQTKFMLPLSLPSVRGWMSLVSIYGSPFKGPSPWQIMVEGDEFVWQRNGNSRWDIPWQAPLIKGRWVTVLLHERFGTDGWVEMWFDGQRAGFFRRGRSYNPSRHAQTGRLKMATMDSSNNRGPNAAKIMQYRQAGMFSWGTVYFGALRIGETRASVEPRVEPLPPGNL